ncbi:transketolase [Escherichia coli]|uniref:transketolase n=1 Tax=Escherichia coli TaxID=562 RepID=A0A377K1G8_ECOLX|nr:transketolase [Escherichia coli]
MLKDCAGQPELIFIATGSEVELAVAAYEKLTAEGVKARVVSMPSTDAFDKQDAAYRESVLPKAVTARVAVEAGIADYWYKYVGLNGAIVGMTTFGESAPAEQLFEEFGFTVDNVVAKAKSAAVIGKMFCEKGRKCGPSDCWQSARCLCRMRRERLIRPTRFCKFNILQEVCRPDKRSASGSFVFAISLKGRESGPFFT